MKLSLAQENDPFTGVDKYGWNVQRCQWIKQQAADLESTLHVEAA